MFIPTSLGCIELVNGAIFDPVMPHALKITQKVLSWCECYSKLIVTHLFSFVSLSLLVGYRLVWVCVKFTYSSLCQALMITVVTWVFTVCVRIPDFSFFAICWRHVLSIQHCIKGPLQVILSENNMLNKASLFRIFPYSVLSYGHRH